MSDRHELQSAGTHPAPCARHCESTAYEIEIRRLRHDIEHHVRIATEAIQEAEQLRTELAVSREREARMRAIAESAIKTRSRDVSDWADDMRRVAALAEGAQEPVHRPVHRPVHQPVHGELNNEA